MDKTIKKHILRTLYHMKERCYNENDHRYKDWGGRGITICQDWLSNPDSFVSWALSNGYKEGLTIDRIDNDGNYCPENCRWVTRKENNQNRRNSRFYTIDGETHNLQQWCDLFGVSWSMVNKRLSLGWDIETALKTPKRERDTDSLIGKQFGKLKVLDFYGVGSGRKSQFKCICECGKTVIVDRQKLLSGHTKSCGCARKSVNAI